jgi:hypothetical protein
VAYRIIYCTAALEHLRGLTARQQATVMATVNKQLVHQPTVPTRNRKPLEANVLAP